MKVSMRFRIHGLIVNIDEESLNRSPLLSTLVSTELPVDRNEDGDIIIDDIECTEEELDVYVKYLNTYIIEDVKHFNVSLFSYMGHEVDLTKSKEFNAILLMSYNDDPMRGGIQCYIAYVL